MAQSAPGSFRLFTAFGIDVSLHWSWFLIAVIQIQAMRGAFDGAYWHVLLYLSLFGIVLLHEFGHALACRSVGGVANHITLWPLGGIAYVQPPQRPGPVLWSIAAGPLVNVVLVPILFGASALLGTGIGEPATDLDVYLLYLNVINLFLLLFNILPIYPLDGGQIVQAILWFFLGRATSLKITAGFGLFVAVAVAIPLLLYQEYWLVLMALFIGWQAWRGLQFARALAAAEAQHGDAQGPWKM